MGRKVVRYSEAFKLHVVSGLESGDLSSIADARRRYGIKGIGTVERWVRRYGRNHLLPKVVRVEKPGERDQLKVLAAENARLKQALADAHMESVLYRQWFEVACRELGVEDVEGFKKKLASRP
jgi:transposase-like protein